MVGKSWQGWAAFRISKKQKDMKDALKTWGKVEFGSIQWKLDQVEKQLHDIDLKAESGPLQQEESIKRRELKSKMWKLGRQLEWMWLQKSRVQWHLKGDRNTNYFHRMANFRQRSNSLNSIIINDVLIEDPINVKQEVHNFFEQLYVEDWDTRGLSFIESVGSRIDDQMKECIIMHFSYDEVWNAMKSCDGNKAPGPDGFNLLSIKKRWSFMKDDIRSLWGNFTSMAN